MTADYANRFEVMRENIHKKNPLPTTIFNIMSGLHISQKLACQMCYDIKRSNIRTYLRKELENPEEIPIGSPITPMPYNMWRYFKLNCAVFADRYAHPATYNGTNSKYSGKPLLHISLDYIRFLNNWYSIRASIFNEKKHLGLFLDKSDLEPGEPGIKVLLEKGDELASIYGFSTAEDFFEAKLLYPEKNKVTLEEVF